MTENSDLFAFYLVTENDDFGETAHGPYKMAEAESRQKVDEKIITRKHLTTLRQQNRTTFETTNEESDTNSFNDEKMLRGIKSWGIILLIIGTIQIFTTGESINTWGLLLIAIGLSSFYFRSPAMFVIYGTTLSWAAISNALSGSGGWATFSLLQVFFAFQTFRQFFQFRSSNKSLQYIENEQPNLDKAARPFPWTSLAFGVVSFIGLITLLLGVIIFISITGSDAYPAFLDILEGLVVDFAVIGFATGLAAILSGYKYKLVSIIGMIAGALVLLIEIGLAIL